MYTWGKGTKGRLGHGNEADLYNPTKLAHIEDEIVQFASTGSSTTVAVTSECRHIHTRPRRPLAMLRTSEGHYGGRIRDYVSMSDPSTAWIPSGFEVDPSAGPAVSVEIFARLRRGMSCRLALHRVEASPQVGHRGP